MLQESEREFVVTHNADIKPVSYFTGRETELQELRRRIEDGRKSVLVSGMGGIGKTHICRKLFEEYLNKHAEDENGPFRHIGYIEYSGDMGNSLQNCLKYKEQDSPEQNQEAAWKELEHLASEGKLLLFVDNVDRPVSADQGLRRLKGIPGAVILTSRQASISDGFEPYRIGFLGMEQCKEIYWKIRHGDSGRKAGAEDDQELEYVIGILAGKHTITVELLAHLAHTKLWTVKRLRQELEQKGFRLEFHKDGELVNIQKSYETLYDLSKLTDAEKNILEAFSVFPYIPLAVETCNKWLLMDAGVSEEDDILMGLYQKGWLQFDIKQESFALHPVFAQFIYGKCRLVPEKHQGLIESCRTSLSIPQRGSVLECQKYIPFAENMIEKLCLGKNLEETSFISVAAYLLYYIAEYEKAAALYEKSLRIIERVLGEEHPDTAKSYGDLACMYAGQGEYKKAEGLYEKSLRIIEKVFGEGHPNTARGYSNLAYVYASQGEYKKAEELCEKNLRISERVLGEEHPDTSMGYYYLAYVYMVQGEYKKAEELCEKSLRISERVLGEEHRHTAMGYSNLAYVYASQGEYKRAEGLYEKSLRISERAFGEEHPYTASEYSDFAYVYASQGEYKKAEELCEKSLRISERVLGKEHLDTAMGYSNLAYVYASQGEYKKAEVLYEKSLRIMERVLGEEHPDTATGYNNLAGMYFRQRKYELALSYLIKAYKIVINKLGSEHPNTIMYLQDLETAFAACNPEGDFAQWLKEKMKE